MARAHAQPASAIAIDLAEVFPAKTPAVKAAKYSAHKRCKRARTADDELALNEAPASDARPASNAAAQADYMQNWHGISASEMHGNIIWCSTGTTACQAK